MRRNVKNISIAVSIAAVLSGVALFGSFKYVQFLANEQLETDVTKVKQSFSDSIKSAENIAGNLQSLLETVGTQSEPAFQMFAANVIAKYPFVKEISFYQRLDSKSRPKFEANLRKLGRGQGILETDPNSADEVVPSGQKSEYLALSMVDKAAAENSYYGWDLLSDAGKKNAATESLAGMKLLASESYLLESGNAAIDLFAPVAIDSNNSGVIGITIDVPKLLGDEQWRKNVTVILSSILAGESVKKDLYRSLDQSAEPSFKLNSLSSNLELTNFGQTLGLRFERVLDISRIKSGILAMVLAACCAISLLAVFLAKTLANLANSLEDLAKLNTGLEKTVEDRTKNLSEANVKVEKSLANLEQANGTLQLQAKMLEIYLRLIFHDLATPLTVCEFNLKRLKTLSLEAQAPVMEKVANSLARIGDLLVDTRSFFQGTVPTKYCSPNQLTADIQQMYDYRLTEKSMRITEKNSAGESTQVKVPRSFMVHQIIANFISNSIKYSPSESEILIAYSAPRDTDKGKFIDIVIRDYGKGMTKEQVDAFATGQVSASTEGVKGEKGTGSGVMIAKFFLEKFGGTIAITSYTEKTNDEAQGTAVKLSIPVSIS